MKIGNKILFALKRILGIKKKYNPKFKVINLFDEKGNYLGHKVIEND